MSKEQARYTYVYRVTDEGAGQEWHLADKAFAWPLDHGGYGIATRIYQSSEGGFWVVPQPDVGEPYPMPDLDSAIASAVMKVRM